MGHGTLFQAAVLISVVPQYLGKNMTPFTTTKSEGINEEMQPEKHTKERTYFHNNGCSFSLI